MLHHHAVTQSSGQAVQKGLIPLTLLLLLLQGGCGVGRPFFHVTRCADDVGGGFSTDYGVS
jgi:hypothetical protein